MKWGKILMKSTFIRLNELFCDQGLLASFKNICIIKNAGKKNQLEEELSKRFLSGGK